MKIKICTPVIGKSLNEFLRNLDRVQEVSEMVELRVDGINDLTEKDLEAIREKTKKGAILTSKNKKLINKGFDLGFDFVDINLSLISKLNLTEKRLERVVLSFHDFEKTPDIDDLEKIVKKMRRFHPEIIKIATKANNDQDIKNLMQILINKKEKEKTIVVGMGEKGKITRILGPLLGSFLTFASTKFGKSAPGQIDINNMNDIYKLLAV